jgi:phage gp37-like protein
VSGALTTHEAAAAYIARGWSIVAAAGKMPLGGKRWQEHALITKADEVAGRLKGHNVGVMLGPKSNGLVDLDLDCPEAIIVAPLLLPPTKAIFGRASKRASHRLYYSQDFAEIAGKGALQFQDPDPKLLGQEASAAGKKLEKAMLLEARCGGGGKAVQTIFPPSRHVDTGELIAWENGFDGEPTTIGGEALLTHIHEVAAAVIFARRWPPVGARHGAGLAVGGFLSRCRMARPRIKLFCEALAGAAGADKDHTVRCAIDSAEAYASGEHIYGYPRVAEIFGEKTAKKCAELLGYKADGVSPVCSDANMLPEVLITEKISEVATRAEEALRAAGVPLYQRGGSLVRPLIEEVDAAHGRRTLVAHLKSIDPTYLRDLMDRTANWSKYDGRAKTHRPTTPSLEIALTILARGADEWRFPVLAGLISTPTMRPDGTLLIEPGYDEATKLLLVAPPTMPPIPDAPTIDDARAALALLEDLLTEFPFKDDISLAVALSALITPVVRGAFMVAPMHVASAPTAGTGKSYLFDVAAALAIGQIMPVMSAGQHEEETEKRLGAAVLAGQPLISIDNVTGELGGAALCQIIERPTVDIRVLGKSERVRINARGTTLYCTGNNVVLVGDVCRRAITATLDAGIERPELREFTDDPVAKVLENRGSYIAAALTICRAYVVAGRPKQTRRLASFEGWSDVVRSALTWLGKADCVGSMEMARSDDPERTALRDMLRIWGDTMGIGWTHRCKLQDLIDKSNEFPELKAAIETVAGARAPADVRSLGAWAKRNKDRIIDEVRLVNKPDHKHGSEWWVENRDQKERPPKSLPASITLNVWIEHETEKAVKISGLEAWLPKCAILTVPNKDGSYLITVPAWLAKEKGLRPERDDCQPEERLI